MHFSLSFVWIDCFLSFGSGVNFSEEEEIDHRSQDASCWEQSSYGSISVAQILLATSFNPLFQTQPMDMDSRSGIIELLLSTKSGTQHLNGTRIWAHNKIKERIHKIHTCKDMIAYWGKHSRFGHEYFQIYLHIHYVQKLQVALHFCHILQRSFFINLQHRQRN